MSKRNYRTACQSIILRSVSKTNFAHVIRKNKVHTYSRFFPRKPSLRSNELKYNRVEIRSLVSDRSKTRNTNRLAYTDYSARVSGQRCFEVMNEIKRQYLPWSEFRQKRGKAKNKTVQTNTRTNNGREPRKQSVRRKTSNKAQAKFRSEREMEIQTKKRNSDYLSRLPECVPRVSAHIYIVVKARVSVFCARARR